MERAGDCQWYGESAGRGYLYPLCMTNKSELCESLFSIKQHPYTVHTPKVWKWFVKWLQIWLADYQLTVHLLLSNSASSQAHWLSWLKANNSQRFDMKMHLSVSLGGKEFIWQMAEWCCRFTKGGKEGAEVQWTLERPSALGVWTLLQRLKHHRCYIIPSLFKGSETERNEAKITPGINVTADPAALRCTSAYWRLEPPRWRLCLCELTVFTPS